MEASKLILASSSEVRKQILSKYKIPFKAVNHQFNENNAKKNNNIEPADLSQYLAEQKSLSVCDVHSDHIILGCDQVCAMGKKMYSKPKTKDKAIENLLELAGKTHELIGSYAFSKNGALLYSETIFSKMTMKDLTEKDIIEYVELDNPLKSCGSYMFEKNGYKLFSEITGSMEAINGLPFGYLQTKLQEYV